MTARHSTSAARRPSLAWYVCMARLVGARVLLKLPLGLSRLFGVIAIVMAIRCVATIEVILDPQAPAQAIYQWVVQLIILAVSALISWALSPKPKEPEKQKSNVPVVEDGKGIVIICGTVWIEDEIVLAWKDVGTKKIKAQGGKKG